MENLHGSPEHCCAEPTDKLGLPVLKIQKQQVMTFLSAHAWCGCKVAYWLKHWTVD